MIDMLQPCSEHWLMQETAQKRTLILLLLILVIATLVRIAGVTNGLPNASHHFSFHPDEGYICRAAARMLADGDLNPHRFVYGHLTINLIYFFIRPEISLGAVTTDADVYLVGRMISVVLGSCTVLLIYFLGSQLFDRRAGTMAAAIAALSPGHIVHSHFATVDAPLTFFCTLGLLAALKFTDSRRHLWLAIGGVAAGCAAGSKFGGVLALIPLLVACQLSPRTHRGTATLLLSLAATFCATSPYIFIAFHEFLDTQLKTSLPQIGQGMHGLTWVGTANGWWHHTTNNLPYLVGLPLLILATLGLASMLRARKRRYYVLLSFGIVYFVVIGFAGARFLRYTLPLLPVLIACALAFTDSLATCMPNRSSGRQLTRIMWTVVMLSLIIPTGIQTASWLKTDTRTAAARWMEDRVPAHATVGLVNLPWFYTPPVSPHNGAHETRHYFEGDPMQHDSRYTLQFFEHWNVAKLESALPDYFILSEFEWRDEERLQLGQPLAFMGILETAYRKVATFDTFPERYRRVFGTAFAPHDWLYPFPEIRIYKRKSQTAP